MHELHGRALRGLHSLALSRLALHGFHHHVFVCLGRNPCSLFVLALSELALGGLHYHAFNRPALHGPDSLAPQGLHSHALHGFFQLAFDGLALFKA